MADSVSIEELRRMVTDPKGKVLPGGRLQLPEPAPPPEVKPPAQRSVSPPTFGQPSPPGEKGHACPPRIEIDGRMILAAWVLLAALGAYLIDRIF